MAKRSRLTKMIVRGLVASPLIYGGYGSLKNPGGRPKALGKAGLPESSGLVRFNGGAMLTGGVAMTLGILPRLAALGLSISITAMTLVGHPFWKERPETRGQHIMQFTKNLAILAGLINEIISG